LQKGGKQEPNPTTTIKSLMKDLEHEVSLRNTLVSEQENPSNMQNKVRILQWFNIRMDFNHLHLPTKFGFEPRKFAFQEFTCCK